MGSCKGCHSSPNPGSNSVGHIVPVSLLVAYTSQCYLLKMSDGAGLLDFFVRDFGWILLTERNSGYTYVLKLSPLT